MPTADVICPACFGHLQRSSSLQHGDLFECPLCATEFRIGSGEGKLPARWTGSNDVEDRDAKPEDDLDVVADEDKAGRRKRRRRPRPSGAVELGSWIRLGFLHWMPMLPPSLMFCIVLVLLSFVVSLVFALFLLIPVVGPFLAMFCITTVTISWSAGMTLVSIQQLQGKRWSFGDFFSGSQWWLPLLCNWLLLEILNLVLTGLPSFLCGVVMYALGLPDALGQLLGSLIGTLLFILVYPLTWMFSWQLILDGNYGPLEAITENMQMALPHYWKLLLLALLTWLIRGVGYLLCIVGYTAAWPLAVLIESAAYLRLTGRYVAEKASEIN